MKIKPNPTIIVAMDVPDKKAAIELASRLDPNLCRLKVGKELFVAEGPAVVEILRNLGFEIFLDLKFHDIPNTVAGAIRSATNLGVWMVNVHALGGRKMMMAAIEAVSKTENRPLIIAVTILTSMNQDDLHEVGIGDHRLPSATSAVIRLADYARVSGLDGIVCSGQEVLILRETFSSPFLLVTPGIRPSGESQDDQARIVTPEIAITSGADYLVIGRPITGAPDPLVALQGINSQIRLVRK